MSRLTLLGAAFAVVVAIAGGLLIANLFGSNASGETTAFQPQATSAVSATNATAAPIPTAAETAAADTTAAAEATVPAAATAAASPTARATTTATPAATASSAVTATTGAAATTEAGATTEATATTEAAVTTQATAAANYIEYTVKRGDILARIARNYNVTVQQILAINDISNPDRLTIGQIIRIPRP